MSKNKTYTGNGKITISFDKQLAKNVLHRYTNKLNNHNADIQDYAENLIGDEQKNNGLIITPDDDNNAISIIYHDFNSSNPDEIRSAITKSIKDTIEDDSSFKGINNTYNISEPEPIGTIKTSIISDDVDMPTKIKDILQNNLEDIQIYTEILMGLNDSNNQKIFMTQSDKNDINMVYYGLDSENQGEVEAALTKAVKDTIENNTQLNSNHKTETFDVEVKNAIPNEMQNEKQSISKKPTGIDIALGGGKKSPIKENAGVMIVSLPENITENQNIRKILSDNVEDIQDYTENLLGLEENNEQKIFISKDIRENIKENIKDGKEPNTVDKILVVFKDLSSENEGEVQAALTKAVKDTIENNTMLKARHDDFKISDIQPITEAQLKNAEIRYDKDHGSWMSQKSMNKPISVATDMTLDNNLVAYQPSTNEPGMEM